jgi:hypothetical protein
MTIRRVNHGKYHSYVDETGAKVPSVTTILGDGLAKPALINWAANTTAGYAVDNWDDLGKLSVSARLAKLQKARYAELDAASKKGTAVHKLAEKLVAGEEVEVPEYLAGHVESYVRFLDEWQVDPVAVEQVVYSHKYRYAGTLDLIADFPTIGKRLLCDVKTAKSGVFPDNALQLSAYRYAECRLGEDATEQPNYEVDGCAVIHVRADGYDLVPVQAGPAEMRFFLYCQQLWRWMNDHSKTVVHEAMLPPRLTEEAS